MARAVGVVLNSYRGIAPIIIIEIDIVVSKMGCLFRAQFSLDVKIPLLRLLFPASAQTHSAENGGKDGCKVFHIAQFGLKFLLIPPPK